MKLKKLNRLLSLTLTAVMVTSMASVPVHAETVTDQPVTVQEQTVGEGEDADSEESVPGTLAEEQEKEGKTDETAEGQTPSNEDTVAEPGETRAEGTEDTKAEPEGSESEETEQKDTADHGTKSKEAQVQESGVKKTRAARTLDTKTEQGGTSAAESVTAETQEDQAKPIIVGEAAGQTATLDEAVDAAAAGEVKVIELAKDVTLSKNLDNVTIKTKGYKITIPEGESVQFGAGTVIENEAAFVADKNATTIQVEGALVIKGGKYHTNGVQVLMVSGQATVEGGEFKCTATGSEDNKYYDGKALLGVHGAGAKLTMTGGTIDAKLGNNTNLGMYGIYVRSGAELELGTPDGKGPTVESMFAAVAMNNTTSPGRITIKGGTYKSRVACTDENEKKFNSVIYLPGNAVVNISGGVFEATGTGSDLHVISIPYNKPSADANPVRLSLNITGGTFKAPAGNTVFYHPTKDEDGSKVTVAVSGGQFSSNIKDELPSTSIASGLDAYQPDGNGMFQIAAPAVAVVDGKKFPTLEAAIAAAATATNKTITLTKDSEFEGSYDLSGLTIDTDGYMVKIPTGKTLELTGGTVKNLKPAERTEWSDQATNPHTIFNVQGALKINGGTYQTKGIQMMEITGTAEIGGNAKLECNAQESDISTKSHYDGASLINVTGSGNLKVMDAVINAKVGDQTTKTDGMYGIYVNHGGTLTLGEAGKNPTIDSMFAPVAMNGLTSPGKITINGGRYTSYAECVSDNIKKFNAVLYLPASAEVTINDGTFTAAGTKGEQHVISVPYSVVNGKGVSLNLVINGGTFTTVNKGDGSKIFYNDGIEGQGNHHKISVRGGSFSARPGYDAGCNAAKQEGDMWVITGTPRHSVVWVSKKDSTCWEEGAAGHYECEYCHKMYESNAADAAELTEKEVVILKKEHVGVKHEAVTEGSCTQATTKEYYECPNCGNCYDSSAALVADTDGTQGKEPKDYIVKAAGHKYKKDDNSYNVTIDTKGFRPADYRQEEANGVTATLSCLNEGCGNKLTADEVFVTIKEGSLKGDCGQPEEMKLHVKAIFKKNDLGEASTDAADFKTVEQDVNYTSTIRPHALDESVVTVNWEKFNVSSFEPNAANRVTATGICKNCGKTVEATTVAVTSDDYPATGVPTCGMTCNFKAKLTFGADIGSGENVQKAPVVTITKAIKGEHTFQPKDKYEPATCMKEGHWGTFECSTCHKEYLGADSEEPVTEEEKRIAKRPHTINDPEFDWAEDAEGNEIVQGLFNCTACNNTVPLTAEKKRNDTQSANVVCGQTAKQVYDVAVNFDKSALVENAEGTELTYNPDLAKPATTVKYTDQLERMETQPHQFEQIPSKNLTVAWADGVTGENAAHDISKGVKVTAVCGREGCAKKLVVTSPSTIDETNSDILEDKGFEYIEPHVELEENEATVPATCQKDGNAVFDVIVTYKDLSGNVVELGETTISTKVNSTPDAHAWGEVTWTWANSTELVEVNATDSVTGETVKCKVPKYKVTAVYACTETGCKGANKVEKVINAASTSTLEGTSMEIEVTLEKGSCVSNSKTLCVAKVYNGKKLIAQSEPKEDNLEATGHKTTVKWEWEDNAEDNNGTATHYKKVTATRYCTVCSDVENAKDQYEKEIASVEIPESGEIAPSSDPTKSITLYVTTGGNIATCDKAGTTNYTAILRQGTSEDGKQIAESKQQMSSMALGHDVRWFIDWKEDTTKTGQDRWKATKTKKCQRSGCTEPAVETKNCEITFQSTPANCSQDGLNTWTLKDTTLPTGEKFADEQCKDGALKAELIKKEQKILKDENAHNYGTAEVVWDEQAAASGADTIQVTCTRTCSYAADNEDHIPAETKTFTAAKQAGEAITDCSEGYEWIYKVSDADKKAVEGWTLPANWKDGVYNHVVPAAEGRKNHILSFIRGVSSNDCTKPAYPDYYECSRCHKTYSDLNCQNEYDGPTKDTAVAQGHLYGTPAFHWVEGKVGKVAEARLECTRSGCAATAKDHFKTIAAQIHEDETLEGVAAQCADTQREPLTVDGYQLGKGEGYQWVRVTAQLTENDTKESMLHMVLPAVEHHFVNGVCEWCKKEGGITIEFYGRDNTNIIGRTYLSSKNLPTDKEKVELATAVNQIGYIFRGWTMEKDGTVVSEDIKQEILDAAKEITTETGIIKVYPVYERNTAGIGSVAVQYVLRTGTTDSVVKDTVNAELAIGSRYETAAQKEETVSGKTVYFSHWERNGEIVGTGLSYELYIQTTSKVSLKAVYVANQSDSKAGKPMAAITDIYTSTVDNVDKLSFSATISVPETGYEVREVGILYSLSNKVVMTDKNMFVDNIGATVDGVVLPHKKYTFTGDSSTKILTIQIPEAMKDRTVYARPYVTVRNTVSGEIETVYGTVKSSSYRNANTSQTAAK